MKTTDISGHGSPEEAAQPLQKRRDKKENPAPQECRNLANEEWRVGLVLGTTDPRKSGRPFLESFPPSRADNKCGYYV